MPLVLETGIKALDLVAPFPRGGHVLLSGGIGNGHLLLLQQVARNVVETYDARVVYVGSVNDQANEAFHFQEWGGYSAAGRFLSAHSTHVLVRQDEPERYPQAAETGLSLAEGHRRDGHDVLLYVETGITLSDGVIPMLRSQTSYSPEAAITVCYNNGLARHVDEGPFAFLDAVARMDIRRSRAGLYPAIDLERSSSRLLTDPRLEEAHRTVVPAARGCFRALAANNLPTPQQLTWLANDERSEADTLFARAVRLDCFLTQPYHGTEMWVGEPGETVARTDTVEGVRQILDGKHDGIAQEAFQNVGTISQALEKAKRI